MAVLTGTFIVGVYGGICRLNIIPLSLLRSAENIGPLSDFGNTAVSHHPKGHTRWLDQLLWNKDVKGTTGYVACSFLKKVLTCVQIIN